MPNMLIIGPQGAGKGTQAALLAGRLDVPHISTGDIFRANVQARTELGLECQRYMDAGELVSCAVKAFNKWYSEVWHERVDQKRCWN